MAITGKQMNAAILRKFFIVSSFGGLYCFGGPAELLEYLQVLYISIPQYRPIFMPIKGNCSLQVYITQKGGIFSPLLGDLY
jgi:hypothetical protein